MAKTITVDQTTFEHFYFKADGGQVFKCQQSDCPVKLVTSRDSASGKVVGRHCHKRQSLKESKKRRFSLRKIRKKAQEEREKCDFERHLRAALLRTNFLKEVCERQDELLEEDEVVQNTLDLVQMCLMDSGGCLRM